MLLIILPDSLKKPSMSFLRRHIGVNLRKRSPLTGSRDQVGIVAWIGKPTRCHSRVGGNPEK